MLNDTMLQNSNVQVPRNYEKQMVGTREMCVHIPKYSQNQIQNRHMETQKRNCYVNSVTVFLSFCETIHVGFVFFVSVRIF